jgi:hypothetical protein
MRSPRRAIPGLVLALAALATAIPVADGATTVRVEHALARSTSRTSSVPLPITPRVGQVAFATTGAIRILMVPIGWPGATQVQRGAHLAELLAGLAAYYDTISQGRLAITGDVAPPVALSGRAHAGRGLADAAVDDALRASGIDPASYDRVVYAYPQIADADWDGQTEVGITAATDWIDMNGDEPTSQLAHELGHTLGLLHAHSDRCSRGILAGRCTIDEYGDATDLMGSGSNAGASTFGAIERYQLGWLTHLGGVVESGVYQLGPLDAPDSGPLPRALVIETARGELWVERAVGRGTFYVHLATTSRVDWGSRLLVSGANAGVFSTVSPFTAAGVAITPLAAADGVLTLSISLR